MCDIAFFVCASYVPWGVHKPWQKNNIFSIFLPWYVYTHGRTSAMAKKIECGRFVPTPWVEDQNVEHQAELTINNNVLTRIREDGCTCRVPAVYLPTHSRTRMYTHVRTRTCIRIQTVLRVNRCGNCWEKICTFHNRLHWNNAQATSFVNPTQTVHLKS